MRDREDYFKDHVEELYKKEREEKRKEKEKVSFFFVTYIIYYFRLKLIFELC